MWGWFRRSRSGYRHHDRTAVVTLIEWSEVGRQIESDYG